MNTIDFHRKNMPVQDFVTGMKNLEMGSAPASGAANDALVVGILWCCLILIRLCNRVRVRREGAPNRSRGGCAPHSFSPLR
jgi:hypothetical protein